MVQNTNLTIRIDEKLKRKAAMQAKKLGVPLTLVVKSALINFVKSPKITIGEPEDVYVSADTQSKMNEIADLL